MKRSPVVILAVVLGLALGGCRAIAEPSSPPTMPPTIDPAAFRIPTHDTSGAQMEALLTGIREETAGCFYVRNERAGRFMVIWPDGFTGRHTAAGDVLVPLAGPPFVLGDVLKMGGGAIEEPPFDLVYREAGKTLDAVCEVPPYWIASDALPN